MGILYTVNTYMHTYVHAIKNTYIHTYAEAFCGWNCGKIVQCILISTVVFSFCHFGIASNRSPIPMYSLKLGGFSEEQNQGFQSFVGVLTVVIPVIP